MGKQQETTAQKLDNFLSNIVQKIENITTLEIQTIVSEMEVKETGTGDKKEITVVPKAGTSAEGMISRIKLVEGDIKTYISAQFAGGEYQTLREFHMLKESQGQEIIRKNIEVIKNIATTLVKMKDGDIDNG